MNVEHEIDVYQVGSSTECAFNEHYLVDDGFKR